MNDMDHLAKLAGRVENWVGKKTVKKRRKRDDASKEANTVIRFDDRRGFQLKLLPMNADHRVTNENKLAGTYRH